MLSPTETRRAAYIYSSEMAAAASALPVSRDRSRMVHALAAALGLFEHVDVVAPVPATRKDYDAFHDPDYVDFLLGDAAQYADEGNNHAKKRPKRIPEGHEDMLEEHGLVDDTPPFPQLPIYLSYVVGATLTAARLLLAGRPLALAWDGGRHHAHRSRAGGFCYLNDLVLGIDLLLNRPGARVMYADLDVHMGDGVFAAFSRTRAVLCASIHLGIPGFYPGLQREPPELGNLTRRPDGLRIGTLPGLSSRSFLALMEPLLAAVDSFAPTFLVIQCGSDGLAGDPLAHPGWNLSSDGLASAAELLTSRAIGLGAGVLITGGGGYAHANVARVNGEVTRRMAGLLGGPLPEFGDVPEHAFFPAYAGDQGMKVDAGRARDENEGEVDVRVPDGMERMRYLDYLLRRADEDLGLLGLR
ncbi:hypothetical protein DFJ74DRAFT_693140 [Hyaloraphidium curvatum]|nr:hypothetical protein DFJ74DRAFT_693140 [Hyaloraphidium curvatum]